MTTATIRPSRKCYWPCKIGNLFTLRLIGPTYIFIVLAVEMCLALVYWQLCQFYPSIIHCGQVVKCPFLHLSASTKLFSSISKEFCLNKWQLAKGISVGVTCQFGTVLRPSMRSRPFSCLIFNEIYECVGLFIWNVTFDSIKRSWALIEFTRLHFLIFMSDSGCKRNCTQHQSGIRRARVERKPIVWHVMLLVFLEI